MYWFPWGRRTLMNQLSLSGLPCRGFTSAVHNGDDLNSPHRDDVVHHITKTRDGYGSDTSPNSAEYVRHRFNLIEKPRKVRFEFHPRTRTLLQQVLMYLPE